MLRVLRVRVLRMNNLLVLRVPVRWHVVTLVRVVVVASRLHTILHDVRRRRVVQRVEPLHVLRNVRLIDSLLIEVVQMTPVERHFMSVACSHA